MPAATRVPCASRSGFVTAHEPAAEFGLNQALGRAGFTFDATEPAPPPFAAAPPRPVAPPAAPAAAAAVPAPAAPRPAVPRPAPAPLAARPLFGTTAAPRLADPAAILVPPAKAEPMALADEACRATAACVAAEQAGVDPARRFHVSVRLRQGHFVRRSSPPRS